MTSTTNTDSKIHGHMRIMPDGTLWAATHFGVQPDETWWASGCRGSWLFSYNINSRQAKNYGVPLIGNMLPCFSLDGKRGRFVATGLNDTMLCWDAINRKVRYAGYPPNGWKWRQRAMLCDEATGKFWGADKSEQGKDNARFRLISFDPEFNRFQRYEGSIPANPESNETALLRGHPLRPAMDGFFYWATHNGTLFRFKPNDANEPLVEPVGVTRDKGRDVLQIGLDPSGRYMYYWPNGDGAPIVQYDVKTGNRKALCWLRKYYFNKYGYYMGGCYSLEISRDGSFLVVCMNGTFQGWGQPLGHPCLLVISIPSEERPLD